MCFRFNLLRFNLMVSSLKLCFVLSQDPTYKQNFGIIYKEGDDLRQGVFLAFISFLFDEKSIQSFCFCIFVQ